MINNEVLIRLAKIDDLEAILSLNKQLFEYERQFGDTYNLDWTYSERGRNCFYDRINSERGIALVAELGGEIIGYVCGLIDTYFFRLINPICELENMFIVEEYRSRNVGKRLVEQFINEATKKGAKRLKVGAIYQNTRAIEFYKRLGLAEFELYLEKNI